MPSNLKHFANDPMNKGRGAGLYYRRHYKGRQWWSKYTEVIDGEVWHKRIAVKNVLKAEQERPHLGDYKTKTKSSGRRTPRLSGGMKGYF